MAEPLVVVAHELRPHGASDPKPIDSNLPALVAAFPKNTTTRIFAITSPGDVLAQCRHQERRIREPRSHGFCSFGIRLLLIVPLTVLAQTLGLYAAVRFRMYEVAKRHERSERLAVHAVEDDRSRIVGEVGAMLAHEVRNPLTGIRSLTQQLGDPGVDDGTRRRYTELILKEVDRLEALVQRVLDRSKRPVEPPTRETEPWVPEAQKANRSWSWFWLWKNRWRRTQGTIVQNRFLSTARI